MMVRLPHTPEVIARGKRLGSYLREARGSRSIVDVARHSGVSGETLRKIESGRLITPSFATVASVASTLGVSLDAIAAHIDSASNAVTR